MRQSLTVFLFLSKLISFSMHYALILFYFSIKRQTDSEIGLQLLVIKTATERQFKLFIIIFNSHTYFLIIILEENI